MSYNKTYFLVPLCFDNYEHFTEQIDKNKNWSETPDRFGTMYLLKYAHKLSQNRDCFRCYTYADPSRAGIYMYETYKGLKISARPQLTEILLTYFGTGIGFLCLRVEYDGCTVDDIVNFSYRFKKAANYFTNFETPEGKRFLIDAARAILPDNVEVFFSSTDPVKCECKCFHMIRIPAEEQQECPLDRYCSLLQRSYSTSFDIDNLPNDERYDMKYEQSKTDIWGGSQEALANVCVASSDETAFVNTYKEKQLSSDFLLMYLLILNQRYAGIRYIEELAETRFSDLQATEKLAECIIRLKTAYSFRVISDDKIYQNIYTNMYRIMEIDKIIDDLADNEQQLEAQHNKVHERRDRTINLFLIALSVLTIFSALIDAADFFDRFSSLAGKSATIISLTLILLVVALGIFFVIRNMKSNRKK